MPWLTVRVADGQGAAAQADQCVSLVDKSAFITGQNICVDAGLLARQPFVADFRTDIRYSGVRGVAAAAVAGDLQARPGGAPGVTGRRVPAAMPARAAMAVPQAAGTPGGSAQAPSAWEGMSRKPPAKAQNR